MEAFFYQYQEPLRLISFAGILVVMCSAEALFPRRQRGLSRLARWPSNFGLMALNALLLRFTFPIAAVGTAALSAEWGWGLIPALGLDLWPATLLAFVAMDFAIWVQHVAMHQIPFLWRFHRMHHTDVDLDATSGARFHPGEIFLSMLYKIVVVFALGPPVVAVIIFEVLLTGAATFNHANVRLPVALDRVLRLVIVTPDFHRVHHSTAPRETNSNYGFFIPWWDRLFGVYNAEPKDGHDGMTLGLDFARDAHGARLDQLLVQPLRPAAPTDTGAATEKRLQRNQTRPDA